MSTIKTDPRIGAFLDLIAWSEGTDPNPFSKYNGYDTIVSGVDGRHSSTDFSVHPFALGRQPIIVKPTLYNGPTGPTTDTCAASIPVTVHTPELRSTASGRYQIIWPTWRTLAAQLHLGTFGPQNQDLAAVELLTQNKALPPLLAGDVITAIHLCCQEWASFPGNNDGQGGKQLAELLEHYDALLSAQHE